MSQSQDVEDVLGDFEAFLEQDFEPVRFANDLLLATNDSNTDQLDTITSIKRLNFDIDECSKRITAVSSKNHDSLFSGLFQMEQSKDVVISKINPSIDKLNNSFDRVKGDFIKPYDNAVKINNALKKIHQTLDLLRGTSFFVQSIQQLEELEQLHESPDNTTNKDLIKLSRLHIHLAQIYESNNLIPEHSSNTIQGSKYSSLRFVRDYCPIQTAKMKALKDQSSSLIANEISHKSSFHINNMKLLNTIVALYILDEKELYQTMDKSVIGKNIQQTSTYLNRSVQAPKNFNVIVSEVQSDSREFLDKLVGILDSCDTSGIDDHLTNTGLAEKVATYLGSPEIESYYWKAISHRLKKSIVATMARGGHMAKNLQTYEEGLKRSLVENFDEPVRSIMLDALSVIRGKN